MKTKDQEDEEKVPIINSDINQTCLNHEEVLEEKCYGWWVVLSCFLCNMIIDGIGYSYGVLLEPLKSEFQSGTGSVALVGSILAGVIMLTGPVAAASVNRYDRLHTLNDSILLIVQVWNPNHLHLWLFHFISCSIFFKLLK